MKDIKDLTASAMRTLTLEKPKENPSPVSNSAGAQAGTLVCMTCESEALLEGDRIYECRSCVQKRRESKFRRTCPSLYQTSDFTRFPKPQFERVMKWPYSKTGLLLIGETGTCKTRMAWTLIKKLMIEDGCNDFVWFDCTSFGLELSRQYRDEAAEEWIQSISERSLVFFDDLGKLKLTDRAEAELFGIVERRTANELPIIATTNDTGDSLAARMTENRGPALIRRLREFCEIIPTTPTSQT